MNYRYFSICLFVMVVISFSCKKNGGLLPPALICKINGEIFKPESSIMSTYLDITFYRDTVLVISALNVPQVIAIGIKDLSGITEGIYKLEAYSSQLRTNGNAIFDDNMSTDRYRTNNDHIGYLLILDIDHDEKRIKAKFEYEAYNDVKKDKAVISDGEIDAFFTLRK